MKISFINNNPLEVDQNFPDYSEVVVIHHLKFFLMSVKHHFALKLLSDSEVLL